MRCNMLNQKRLYVSLLLALLLIVTVTVVLSEGAAVTPEAASAETIQEQEKSGTEIPTETNQEPESETGEADPEKTQENKSKESTGFTDSASIWISVYKNLKYGEPTAQNLAVLALVHTKQQEQALKTADTDQIVNYHGTRFAVSQEEYEVLLRIVEAEAPEEDIEGRMLVANVILNRVFAEQFPDTITEVVFQKEQFSPISDGTYYVRTVSEETKEAVERVLSGEDLSQGALYFVARSMAAKSGLRFFDQKLQFLFKHGVHEFYTEK